MEWMGWNWLAPCMYYIYLSSPLYTMLKNETAKFIYTHLKCKNEQNQCLLDKWMNGYWECWLTANRKKLLVLVQSHSPFDFIFSLCASFSPYLCDRPEVFTLVPVSKVQWRQTSPCGQEHEGLIRQPFPAPDSFTPWLGLRPPCPWPPCTPWFWFPPFVLPTQPHGELPHGLPPPLLAAQFHPLWLHDDVPCHDAPSSCIWPHLQQHLP